MPVGPDNRLAAVTGRITAQETPFETGQVERNGQRLRCFATAPATLPALFDHFCAQHGDLQDEDEARRHLAGRIAAFKVQPGREDRALPRPCSGKIGKRAFKARCSQAWEVAKATL